MKKYRNAVVAVLGVLLWAAGFWMVRADRANTLGYVCIGLGCGMFGHGTAPLCSAGWRLSRRTSGTWPLPTAPRAAPLT